MNEDRSREKTHSLTNEHIEKEKKCRVIEPITYGHHKWFLVCNVMMMTTTTKMTSATKQHKTNSNSTQVESCGHFMHFTSSRFLIELANNRENR